MKAAVKAAALAAAVAIPSPVTSDTIPFGAYESLGFIGSDVLTIHALSLEGLPLSVHPLRENALRQAGFAGPRGTVSTRFQFSPVLSYDTNINGGFANDQLTVGPFTFLLNEQFKAVSGVVLGASFAGGARFALAENMRADLRFSAIGVWSPEHEMGKLRAQASGCVTRLVGTSTGLEGCVDGEYSKFDLGESNRIGASMEASRGFATSAGFHELAANVRVNRHGGAQRYTQTVVGGRVSSSLSDGVAISAGLRLGERLDRFHVMRERLDVSVGTLVNERPVRVGLAAQRNRGGLFLGERRESTILALSLTTQIFEKGSVTFSASRTKANHSFFDDSGIGVSFSWRL